MNKLSQSRELLRPVLLAIIIMYFSDVVYAETKIIIYE